MSSLESKTDQQVETNSVHRIQESKHSPQSQRLKFRDDHQCIRNALQLPANLRNLFNARNLFELLIVPYFYGRTVNVPPPPYNSSHESEAIDLANNSAKSVLMNTESNSEPEIFVLGRRSSTSSCPRSTRPTGPASRILQSSLVKPSQAQSNQIQPPSPSR